VVIVAAVVGAVYGVVTLVRPNDSPAVASGWAVASPAAEGFAPARFARVMKQLPHEHKGVFALLVARDGKLVFERYYHDYPHNSGFEMYSITKSVTSALVGIAIRERRIKSVDEPLRDFFPTPPRAGRIRIRELLTMTAGWPGDNDPRNDIGDNPANLVRALLHRPLVHKPRTTFAYDSSSTHILSAVLTKVTGVPEERYARRRLFAPLGITVKDFWPKDEHGITFGGNGLTLLATDAAKLGQLYLQHGRWHGRQIVPRRWVDESTRQHVALRRASGYGYGWWTQKRAGGHAYLALGYGGQVVAVVPKLQLVVAVFSDPAWPEVPIHELLGRIQATVTR
jgi:CubicO group peptidase (beta-lactamase class C family)